MTTSSYSSRLAKDDTLRELKRVKSQILELKAQQDEEALESEDDDEGDALLISTELLRASEAEERISNSATRWDLPLPVPIELEDLARLNRLLTSAERAFFGLHLSKIKRAAEGGAMELNGVAGAGMVEFAVRFQSEDGNVKQFRVTKLPRECEEELRPLIELAKSRNCVRTWLVGVAEYGVLVSERQHAFREVRRLVPAACVEIEQRNAPFIELTSGRDKTIRFVWRPTWTALPKDVVEPNEFLVPECTLRVVEGEFSDAEKRLIEESGGFDVLVRQFGVVTALVKIAKALTK